MNILFIVKVKIFFGSLSGHICLPQYVTMVGMVRIFWTCSLVSLNTYLLGGDS